MAGIEVPVEEFDSQSLVPLLTDPARSDDQGRLALFTYNPAWPGLCRDRLKLVERRQTDERVLLDLEADPNESVNLADDPGVAAELAELRGLLAEALVRPAPSIGPG